MSECPQCEGEGVEVCTVCQATGVDDHGNACEVCEGEPHMVCQCCDGTGDIDDGDDD